MEVENKNTEEPIEEKNVEETNDKKINIEGGTEKSKISENAEEIKNETKDTVNKVKDTIKNTDFKKDASATKGFIKELFFNPFEVIKRVASGENIISKAVIIMAVYIIATVLVTVISLIKYGSGFSFGQNTLKFLVSFVKPILDVVILAIIVFIFNKENKKKLVTVISTIIVAFIPQIVSSVLVILDLLINKITLFTNPIETVLTAISAILLYFGIKELFGKEDNNEALKKYAIILLISELIIVVLSEIGIY